MESQNNRERLVAGATRTLAIIGFIAVIIGGLWGTVFVARNVPGAFSALASAIVSLTSIFVPAEEAITLSIPSPIVKNGETFVLSWEHERKGIDGSYTFRYECVEGVSFTSPTQAGPDTKVVCNTPFNFLNASESIVVTVSSLKNSLADVTAYIDFTPSGSSESTVTGSTLFTIQNENITSPSAGPTGGATTPRTAGPETTTVELLPGIGSTVSDPRGRTDLSVRLIEIGLVDKTTGEFTASSTPSASAIGKRIAARFAVENIGTRSSDQWTFNAVLPTFPSHIYSSPTQPALTPGDRIEFTLGFDRFEQDGEGVFVVNVDPTQKINESNKDNNILRVTITATK